MGGTSNFSPHLGASHHLCVSRIGGREARRSANNRVQQRPSFSHNQHDAEQAPTSQRPAPSNRVSPHFATRWPSARRWIRPSPHVHSEPSSSSSTVVISAVGKHIAGMRAPPLKFKGKLSAVHHVPPVLNASDFSCIMINLSTLCGVPRRWRASTQRVHGGNGREN